MTILLDTHTLLWFLESNPQLPTSTRTRIETTPITLDEPLTLAHNSRVRVIVLVSEEDPDDTPIAEIRESIYRGWQDALAGRTKPVSQLWEGLDVD